MKEIKHKEPPEKYFEDFKKALSELYKSHKTHLLFNESSVNIKYYPDDSENKPIYTQEAEFFLKEYDHTPKEYFSDIEPIIRKKEYKQINHDGTHIKKENGKCKIEPVEAKAIFNSMQNSTYPFKIIDYEVPLKGTSKDVGIGEIDLIGKKDDVVYLLELKRFKKPNGTLFHMILQSYTYMKLLDIKKFKKEYECKKVIPSILVFEGSENFNQFNDPRNGIFKELLKHLDMKAFVVKRNTKSVYKDDEDIYSIVNNKPILNNPAEIVELN